MRTSVSKKYLCLIVVLLFLIPTVTALNINDDSNQNDKKGMSLDKDIKFPDSNFPELEHKNLVVPECLVGTELSTEVESILEKYNWDDLDQEVKDFVIEHNMLMLARRAKWTAENPRMPYEPLDITEKIGKIDPVTEETTSFFPNTQLRRSEPEMCDPNNYQPNKLLSDSPNTKYVNTMVESKNSQTTMSTSTRAPEADIELDRLEWTYVQQGWAEQNEIETSNNQPVPGNQYSYGGFQVGKKTTFTATVRNNNPGAGSVSVWVNYSMSEFYTLTPLQRNPTSKKVTVGGTPVTVTLDFTPPAAGSLLIQCLVEYDNDPDTSNNYIGWRGIPIFIWSADLESGGTNYGWQKLADGTPKQHQASDWTGDKGATNAWHSTSGPANQQAESHTQSNAWFHGEDVGGQVVPDTYADNMNRNIDENGRNHTYLQTPYINLGDIMDDDRTVMGISEANRFYIDYMVLAGMLMTGELEAEENAQSQVIYEESDILWNGEYNDANDNNWFYPGYPYGLTYIIGDYSTLEYYVQTPQATPHWNPNFHVVPVDQTTAYLYPGYPLRLFISDASGGVNDNIGGARNWTSPGVRFRLDLDCDGEDDQTSQTGIYADDFAVWGTQDYDVEKRVGITEVTYPKTSGVPIIYKDSTASFTVTVKNWGKLYQSLQVKMTVEDSDGNEVAKYTSQKPAGNLPYDEEKEVQFTWQPQEEGDFTIILEVGSEAEDWTPGDNKADFYVHVSPSAEESDIDVLLVDDDDSSGQMGIWRINTEDKMLKALGDNDIKYRIYTVEYNETGPAVDIMDDYELVIWMTGLDNEVWAHGGRANWNKNNPAWDITLKTDDIDEIESFLNGKDKKVWVISPGFMYDYYGMDYKTIPPGDFAREYLHLLNCQANLTQWNNDNTEIVVQGTPNPLEGVPDSAMDEAEYITYDSEPPFGFTDIGGVVEKKDPGDDDTTALFYQDAAHLQHNALLYKGEDHMACFFGFNFYLLDDKVVDPDTKQTDAANCVYRLLTGFGMTGGVLIELFSNNERIQWVYPDNSTTYQLKVTNLGKKQDTMELSVKATYSKDYPTKYKDWSPTFEGDDVKLTGGKATITLNGLQTKQKIYLRVTAPEADDYSEYPAAGDGVVFTITSVSQNTKLDNITACVAKVPTIGKITMDCQDTDESIKVDEIAKFLLELYNETNAEDDVNVELSFSGVGANLAKFVVNNKPTTNKKVTVTLGPNDVNDDVQLHVTAEEHTIAGYHNVTVLLRDETGVDLFDEIELSVEVKQFYQVECNTSGDENGATSFVIDPNEYTEQGLDNITKTFTINVRNWGNGYDMIQLDTEENINSDDTSDWETKIYTKSGSNKLDIEEISVINYDETRKPDYGEEKVYFDVHIPIEIEVGIYRIDLYIESDGTEAVGEADNNVVTFTFRIIKPNLKYTKLNNKSQPNFEFSDFNLAEPIIEDPLNEYGDYYIEYSYKDFDLLTIEIKVDILNDGDNEIELSKEDVWLNITYEDEFGTTIYELYSNLTPVSPTSSVIIPAGGIETFTFRWDPETPSNPEPFEYTFELTVDPNNKIYEKDETDNTASFELFVKHIPKPKKKTGSGGMPGFESAFVVIAITLVILSMLYSRRRRH